MKTVQLLWITLALFLQINEAAHPSPKFALRVLKAFGSDAVPFCSSYVVESNLLSIAATSIQNRPINAHQERCLTDGRGLANNHPLSYMTGYPSAIVSSACADFLSPSSGIGSPTHDSSKKVAQNLITGIEDRC